MFVFFMDVIDLQSCSTPIFRLSINIHVREKENNKFYFKFFTIHVLSICWMDLEKNASLNVMNLHSITRKWID